MRQGIILTLTLLFLLNNAISLIEYNEQNEKYGINIQTKNNVYGKIVNHFLFEPEKNKIGFYVFSNFTLTDTLNVKNSEIKQILIRKNQNEPYLDDSKNIINKTYYNFSLNENETIFMLLTLSKFNENTIFEFFDPVDAYIQIGSPNSNKKIFIEWMDAENRENRLELAFGALDYSKTGLQSYFINQNKNHDSQGKPIYEITESVIESENIVLSGLVKTPLTISFIKADGYAGGGKFHVSGELPSSYLSTNFFGRNKIEIEWEITGTHYSTVPNTIGTTNCSLMVTDGVNGFHFYCWNLNEMLLFFDNLFDLYNNDISTAVNTHGNYYHLNTQCESETSFFFANTRKIFSWDYPKTECIDYNAYFSHYDSLKAYYTPRSSLWIRPSGDSYSQALQVGWKAITGYTRMGASKRTLLDVNYETDVIDSRNATSADDTIEYQYESAILPIVYDGQTGKNADNKIEIYFPKTDNNKVIHNKIIEFRGYYDSGNRYPIILPKAIKQYYYNGEYNYFNEKTIDATKYTPAVFFYSINALIPQTDDRKYIIEYTDITDNKAYCSLYYYRMTESFWHIDAVKGGTDQVSSEIPNIIANLALWKGSSFCGWWEKGGSCSCSYTHIITDRNAYCIDLSGDLCYITDLTTCMPEGNCNGNKINFKSNQDTDLKTNVFPSTNNPSITKGSLSSDDERIASNNGECVASWLNEDSLKRYITFSCDNLDSCREPTIYEINSVNKSNSNNNFLQCIESAEYAGKYQFMSSIELNAGNSVNIAFNAEGSGGVTCDPPLTLCSGICVNTASDENNCGGCGNICGINQICLLGNCQTTETGKETPQIIGNQNSLISNDFKSFTCLFDNCYDSISSNVPMSCYLFRDDIVISRNEPLSINLKPHDLYYHEDYYWDRILNLNHERIFLTKTDAENHVNECKTALNSLGFSNTYDYLTDFGKKEIISNIYTYTIKEYLLDYYICISAIDKYDDGVETKYEVSCCQNPDLTASLKISALPSRFSKKITQECFNSNKTILEIMRNPQCSNLKHLVGLEDYTILNRSNEAGWRNNRRVSFSTDVLREFYVSKYNNAKINFDLTELYTDISHLILNNRIQSKSDDYIISTEPRLEKAVIINNTINIEPYKQFKNYTEIFYDYFNVIYKNYLCNTEFCKEQEDALKEEKLRYINVKTTLDACYYLRYYCVNDCEGQPTGTCSNTTEGYYKVCSKITPNNRNKMTIGLPSINPLIIFVLVVLAIIIIGSKRKDETV